MDNFFSLISDDNFPQGLSHPQLMTLFFIQLGKILKVTSNSFSFIIRIFNSNNLQVYIVPMVQNIVFLTKLFSNFYRVIHDRMRVLLQIS
jgi:hypothetical protein